MIFERAGDGADFAGAKLALFCGDDLLTCLRDDRPDVPWPGHWDLPGGGREGDESPEGCVLRELAEEFGLCFGAERLLWKRAFPAMQDAARRSWFFAGRITAAETAAIVFGNEGQGWRLMPRTLFLTHPQAIPALRDRVAMVPAVIAAG